MTTAASRPGGKFAKSGTAASRPGGKFATLTSKNTECSKDPSNGKSISSPEVTEEILSAKRAKLTRHVVFDDLENAEQLVMETLSIASSTAEAFCHLAQNTQTVASNQKKESESDKHTTRQLQHRIRKNGQEFLSKIKKIHDLLAPHASIVKAYQNLPSEEKITANKESSTLKGNIYVSRLEMRLAVERRQLLREIVRSKDGGLHGGQESEASTLTKNDNFYTESISSQKETTTS